MLNDKPIKAIDAIITFAMSKAVSHQSGLGVRLLDQFCRRRD